MITLKFDPSTMPSILGRQRIAPHIPPPPPKPERPVRLCIVDGCVRKHRANGYCALHGQRARRNGSPMVVKVGGHPKGSHKTCYCGTKAIAIGLCIRHYNHLSYVNRKLERSHAQQV